jgi:fructan beta-fructosidase
LKSPATLALALFCSLAAAQDPPPGRDQPLRPQIHFSPESHWMNDPNGLVFFEGEYHLFYQYNPQGIVPGHISWGHAVSTDLLHWQELGVAIPATPQEMVFTGSVVADSRNSSGLCANGKPCLVAVYTSHADRNGNPLETQSIASSQDRGRTWQRFPSNPVLDLHLSNFRDPSVSWNDDANAWLMVVSLPNDHQVAFYTSPDLQHWTQQSRFGPTASIGGQWECPNLLRIPNANGSESLWALKIGLNPGSLQGGSGEQYFLGSFDGHRFTQSPDPGSHGWTDYGKDSYCAITYNNLPATERPTLIGWMDNWQYADKLPTTPWRGQMTLPRRLTLVRDREGLALSQDPVVAPLRQGQPTLIDATLLPTQSSTDIPAQPPTELELTFDPADAEAFGLRLFSDSTHFTEVGFDRNTMHLYVDRTHAQDDIVPRFPARTEAPLAASRPFDLHLILDRSSLEVFAQHGTISMTNLIFPAGASTQIRSFRTGGHQPTHLTGNQWPLHSIWTAAVH